MQDLKEDLLDSKILGYEALQEIEDNSIRDICVIIFEKTIKNIVRRIDEELLEMEKEQIIKANNRGYIVGRNDIAESANDYYNETFGDSN